MSRTGSPASVPLPRSPSPAVARQDSFDALIDLLADDGGLARLSTTTTALRDDHGNLDLGKIRAALVTDEPGSFSLAEPPAFESTVQLGTPRLRPAREPRRDASFADAPSSLLPSQPGLTPGSAQSVSPLALPAGLAASSHVRDGPVPFDSLLDTPVPDDFRYIARSFPFPAVVRAPPVAGPSRNPDLKRLNDELAKAKEEVRDLKSRMKIMKSLLVRNNDAQHANVPPPAPPDPPRLHDRAPSLQQRDEIDALDGDSARIALRNLLSSLSLPASVVPSLASLSHLSASPAASVQACPASIEEVRDALQLVRDVDELVWRRQRFPGAVAPLDVFHENNIIDLRDRVELWERAVRAPPL